MESRSPPPHPGIPRNPGAYKESPPHAAGFDTAREFMAAPAWPRRMAICSVGELFGGVERHVLGILTGLAARGMTPLLLLFHDGELAAQAREMKIEPVILPNRNRSIAATARQLARLLEQRRIRVVHVHGYKATVFCALARRWHPFAMVKTEHGLPEPMAGRPLHAVRDRLYRLSDRIATTVARATVCYVTKELLMRNRRAHARLRVTTIPNGIDGMERSRLRRPPELREDWFNLAVVGRLDTVKGHHVAIEALAAGGLPPDSHLHFIGDGPTEPELRKLAAALGVSHRVHFLGFRRNVYDYIAHCQALLMPSLHEGLPYVLLEAMALGTPIVASRVGGLAETIQDDVTGLLVTPGDAQALARAIIRLRDAPELGRRLSERARHLRQARYSLDVMTARYLDVYREALAAIDRPSS